MDNAQMKIIADRFIAERIRGLVNELMLKANGRLLVFFKGFEPWRIKEAFPEYFLDYASSDFLQLPDEKKQLSQRLIFGNDPLLVGFYEQYLVVRDVLDTKIGLFSGKVIIAENNLIGVNQVLLPDSPNATRIHQILSDNSEGTSHEAIFDFFANSERGPTYYRFQYTAGTEEQIAESCVVFPNITSYKNTEATDGRTGVRIVYTNAQYEEALTGLLFHGAWNTSRFSLREGEEKKQLSAFLVR